LNGLWNWPSLSLGIEVWADRIPVRRKTSKICSELHLDPLKLMSSGACLQPVGANSVGRVMNALRNQELMLRGWPSHAAKERTLPLQEGKKLNLVAVPQTNFTDYLDVFEFALNGSLIPESTTSLPRQSPP